jgi:arylsulfatase A-like enzyme
MIRSLDRNVGRVLAALKERGLDDDTIVVFTSDNGGTHYIGLPAINRPFRGWKATFFEGGIRVPFFMRWPGKIATGTRYPAPVGHVDIFATALAAAGVPLPTDRKIDGVDLLPYVTGQRAGRPHEALFWRSGPYLAVRSGDWKLQVGGRPAREWLFDLGKDPAEKNDVAAANPQKVAELKALLEQFQREQAKPLWASLIEVPVGVDKTIKQSLVAGDDVIYWSN